MVMTVPKWVTSGQLASRRMRPLPGRSFQALEVPDVAANAVIASRTFRLHHPAALFFGWGGDIGIEPRTSFLQTRG